MARRDACGDVARRRRRRCLRAARRRADARRVRLPSAGDRATRPATSTAAAGLRRRVRRRRRRTSTSQVAYIDRGRRRSDVPRRRDAARRGAREGRLAARCSATNAADLRHVARRACPQRLAGDADWTPTATAPIPPTVAIYTVDAAERAACSGMPALHIMTKELDHWMWITLWWSPQPDADFGADRPATLAPGPWRNYKMCVRHRTSRAMPIRAAASRHARRCARGVNGGVGAPTWCSNPYLELGAGNAATNCIGCHQHGGTALLPEEILAASASRHDARAQQLLHRLSVGDQGRTGRRSVGDRAGRGRLLGRQRPTSNFCRLPRIGTAGERRCRER